MVSILVFLWDFFGYICECDGVLLIVSRSGRVSIEEHPGADNDVPARHMSGLSLITQEGGQAWFWWNSNTSHLHIPRHYFNEQSDSGSRIMKYVEC